jgi:hypothetical protein
VIDLKISYPWWWVDGKSTGWPLNYFLLLVYFFRQYFFDGGGVRIPKPAYKKNMLLIFKKNIGSK